MTKTMKINDLVSKLKEYDGELTVKVWSDGANKAYPISHVFIGSINKEDLVYINIGDRINEKAPVYINIGDRINEKAPVYINIDDRNLVDLSKIWHDAGENPRAKEWIIVQFGEDNYGTMSLSDFGAKVWCNSSKVLRWAYIDDLLPKGGKK